VFNLCKQTDYQKILEDLAQTFGLAAGRYTEIFHQYFNTTPKIPDVSSSFQLNSIYSSFYCLNKHSIRIYKMEEPQTNAV